MSGKGHNHRHWGWAWMSRRWWMIHLHYRWFLTMTDGHLSTQRPRHKCTRLVGTAPLRVCGNPVRGRGDACLECAR